MVVAVMVAKQESVVKVVVKMDAAAIQKSAVYRDKLRFYLTFL